MKIKFKNGIPGFENFKEFIVSEVKGSEEFKMIDSVEDVNIGFVSLFPFNMFPDYELDLDNDTIEELNLDKSEDVLVLNLITLGKTLKDSTVNLQAPIVVNVKNSKAKQLILQNDKYTTKHPLVRSEENVGNH